MGENILLTESNYNDKYPPLGLMKISTFHKIRGDNVIYTRKFVRKDKNYFSKIYISTRFSFHWKKTKELINFYLNEYSAEILLGGIHTSINPQLYETTFGIKPNIGSFKGDIKSIIGKIENDEILSSIAEDFLEFGIDVLPPDYSIFENEAFPFSKVLKESYLLRATKGCKRNCNFCDVKKICEGYINKLPIVPIIKYIEKHFGLKSNIIFFDDNTLMSNRIDEIISDLQSIGFIRGAKFRKKQLTCDFNQGMDLRLLDEHNMNLINSIPVYPIRFAFDDISMKNVFIDKISNVLESGIKNISIYVLYNFKDTPEDFYERLCISARLNQKYNGRIFSFPMKYVPNDQTDRSFIGEYWTKRMIRGVQCILNSTHGIVPVKLDFFHRAFGKDSNEFMKIIHMPENYIIHRYYDQKINTEVSNWNKIYTSLSYENLKIAKRLISNGKGRTIMESVNPDIINFLSHYQHESMIKKVI